MHEYKKGDYVAINYEGELLSGKILEVKGSEVYVEVCVSAMRGEELLTDTIWVPISEIKPLNIKL